MQRYRQEAELCVSGRAAVDGKLLREDNSLLNQPTTFLAKDRPGCSDSTWMMVGTVDGDPTQRVGESG